MEGTRCQNMTNSIELICSWDILVKKFFPFMAYEHRRDEIGPYTGQIYYNIIVSFKTKSSSGFKVFQHEFYVNFSSLRYHSSHPCNMTVLIIFYEECKLWNFSLCCFLKPLVSYSPLDPHIILSFVLKLSPSCCSLSVRDQDSRPCKRAGKIWLIYFNLYISGWEPGRRKILNWVVLPLSATAQGEL
jgi:hypothetical protein